MIVNFQQDPYDILFELRKKFNLKRIIFWRYTHAETKLIFEICQTLIKLVFQKNNETFPENIPYIIFVKYFFFWNTHWVVLLNFYSEISNSR